MRSKASQITKHAQLFWSGNLHKWSNIARSLKSSIHARFVVGIYSSAGVGAEICTFRLFYQHTTGTLFQLAEKHLAIRNILNKMITVTKWTNPFYQGLLLYCSGVFEWYPKFIGMWLQIFRETLFVCRTLLLTSKIEKLETYWLNTAIFSHMIVLYYNVRSWTTCNNIFSCGHGI